MTTKKLSAALGAALFPLALAAGATTITFDALEAPGDGHQIFFGAYEENGFRFSADMLASSLQNTRGWYMGSAGLFNAYAGAYTTLTKVGGGTFDFNAIDLAPLSSAAYGQGATISFTGKLHGGGAVSQSFMLDQSFSFQTFAFTGFSHLDSVTWMQVYPYHQFDNLVLDQSPSAVPEPGTLVLSGLALALLGALRRKPA